MALAPLYNHPVDPASLAQWSFANADHHRSILGAIFDLTGTLLPEYVLDPINPTVMPTWLYQHASMHLNQNQILGISGYDLIGVDWNDPEKLSVWIDQHANEHLRAAQILGVD